MAKCNVLELKIVYLGSLRWERLGRRLKTEQQKEWGTGSGMAKTDITDQVGPIKEDGTVLTAK